MKFSELKVNTRLAIGFGVLLILMTAIATLGMMGLSRSNDLLHHLADVNVTKIELLSDMADSVHVTSRVMRTLALLHDEAEAQRQRVKISEATEKYNLAFESLQKLPLDAAGHAFVDKIREEGSIASTANDKFGTLIKTDTDKAVAFLLSDVIPANGKWLSTLQEFSELQKKKNRDDEARAVSAYESASISMLIFTALAIAIGGLLAWLISRSITSQLGGEPTYAAEIANEIARGELGATILLRSGSNQSLMFALKAMRDCLADIVGRVREGTETIKVASQEISTGNLDLSSRTEQQASSLQETASSMEQLTATVRQNAESANEASEVAQDARLEAEKGGEAVQEVVRTMNSIDESSKKIVDIISVIDGIAFQTNILALNAAVEAARAGEQGRGFAVVATEVRALAQRSANAAKEIKALIDTSVEQVVEGTSRVNVAGETMHSVVASVQRVANIIAEIAAASREQSQGIEQIDRAITEMDNVTQQNAALVEQSAAAAQALQEQAGGLANMVAMFKLGDTRNLRLASSTTAQIPKIGKTNLPVPQRSSRRVANTATNPTQVALHAHNEGWEEF